VPLLQDDPTLAVSTLRNPGVGKRMRLEIVPIHRRLSLENLDRDNFATVKTAANASWVGVSSKLPQFETLGMHDHGPAGDVVDVMRGFGAPSERIYCEAILRSETKSVLQNQRAIAA
jgi:hypothetical protein